MKEKEQLLYTIITVCVIIAGIITGVWLSHQEIILLNRSIEQSNRKKKNYEIQI